MLTKDELKKFSDWLVNRLTPEMMARVLIVYSLSLACYGEESVSTVLSAAKACSLPLEDIRIFNEVVGEAQLSFFARGEIN